MIDLAKKLLAKHRETIAYLFFGVLTVLFNIAVYYLLLLPIKHDMTANSIAYVLSVLFAYWTNSTFVFRQGMGWKTFAQFFGMRIGSILIDDGGLWLLLRLGCPRLVSKFAAAVIVIILNYIFSKFFIFKGKEKTDTTPCGLGESSLTRTADKRGVQK
ncbi:MAG: GtrA family protein [Clostridiales bacterium]|jgi:putative flippase GtrA|nr:GtrA family protein [Clostridiales bacterium]